MPSSSLPLSDGTCQPFSTRAARPLQPDVSRLTAAVAGVLEDRGDGDTCLCDVVDDVAPDLMSSFLCCLPDLEKPLFAAWSAALWRYPRAGRGDEGSFFISLMPPLLYLVRVRTRKAAGCQMRTVIRPVSTGLWLQVQICLQG